MTTTQIELAGDGNGTESVTMTFNNHDTNRQCGSCTLCCKLLPVQELGKPSNTRCRHQSVAKRCAVYRKPGFPISCHVWSCQWLSESSTAKLQRPDRSGYVIDNMPDLIRNTEQASGKLLDEIIVLQVWVDPARPNAYRDPALLEWADQKGREFSTPLIVRFGTEKAIVGWPPSMSPDGQWHWITNGEMDRTPTTGSYLLDKMAGL